ISAPVGMGLWGDLHLRWQCREERGAEQWRENVRWGGGGPDGVGRREFWWPQRRFCTVGRVHGRLVHTGYGVSAVLDRTLQRAQDVGGTVALRVLDVFVSSRSAQQQEPTAAAFPGEGVAVGRVFTL